MMSMSWKEFKSRVEDLGVKDEDKLHEINVLWDAGPEDISVWTNQHNEEVIIHSS